MDAQPQSAPIDPRTGELKSEWRRYLKQLDAAVRALQAGG